MDSYSNVICHYIPWQQIISPAESHIEQLYCDQKQLNSRTHGICNQINSTSERSVPKIFVYSTPGMTEHRLKFWRVVYIKKQRLKTIRKCQNNLCERRKESGCEKMWVSNALILVGFFLSAHFCLHCMQNKWSNIYQKRMLKLYMDPQ